VRFLQKTMLPLAIFNIAMCVVSYEFLSKDLAFLNFLTACVCYLSWKIEKLKNGL
tara:strand:- start:150 stop:314 length:165 start_codon:yes stop_codon:yes gene_type:complete